MVVRDARGREVGHRITYELVLSDGRVLRTRISGPPNRETYGQSLWSSILHDQLCVDEASFWACVVRGVTPERGKPRSTGPAVPAEVASLLISKARLPEAEVAAMTRDEAITRLNRYWTETT